MEPLNVLRRFKEDLYHFRTDKELAEFLGMPQSTISTWWKRNTCDLWVLAEHIGEYSYDYLMTGEGPKKRGEMAVTNGAGQDRELDVQRNTIQELQKDKEFLQRQVDNLQKQLATLSEILIVKK